MKVLFQSTASSLNFFSNIQWGFCYQKLSYIYKPHKYDGALSLNVDDSSHWRGREGKKETALQRLHKYIVCFIMFCFRKYLFVFVFGGVQYSNSLSIHFLIYFFFSKSCSKDTRKKLLEELYGMIKGKAKEVGTLTEHTGWPKKCIHYDGKIIWQYKYPHVIHNSSSIS